MYDSDTDFFCWADSSCKTRIDVPFAISPALVGIGLMHIGRLLRPYEQRIVRLESLSNFIIWCYNCLFDYAE